eukprot:8280601-Ditylum_brightwellii.AAC.1
MEELRILQHPTTQERMTAILPPMLDNFNRVGMKWSTKTYGRPHDQASSANHNKKTGLNTVSIHNIVDDAFDRCGQIHDDPVSEYTSMYNAPINMSKDADQPITNAQLAAKGQLHWKCQYIALKTWTEFRTFWNQEFSDCKTLSRISAKEAGFGANAALQTNPNIHELEESMDNLAFAATTSNNVLGQLTENNTKLTTQLADAMRVTKQLQDENTKLLKQIELNVSSGTGMAEGKPSPRNNHNKNNRK